MKKFDKVVVLGAGVMGSTIAAHLANIGIRVHLLDMVPKEGSDRSAIARKAMEGLAKQKPSPVFSSKVLQLITPGNFEDDIHILGECDWAIEVIVENMEIKKSFYREKVVPHLHPEAILSSNTSGLSVNEMATVLPDEMKKRFLITHFFNPPRYMRLVEVIPNRFTDPSVVKDIARFLTARLGKGVVYAKDTPNFIANRIGVYSIFNAFRHMADLGLTVEEVDAIAGPPTARPKSAAFRTIDLVGVDTLVHVGKNSYTLLPDDAERDIYKIPAFLEEMVKKGALGNKTGFGFYKQERTEGEKKIFFLDLHTGEYKPVTKPKFPSVENAKQMESPAERIRTVLAGKDKAAEFAWRNLRDTLIYSFRRIPEIADDIVNVDNAMRWGFNWELGPFEMLDAIGVQQFVERCEKEGTAVPAGLKGIDTFYKIENGVKYYFDLNKRTHVPLEIPANQIFIPLLKSTGKVVETSREASILDMGDGVFLLEFHSKMNSIGGDILNMVHKVLKRAQEEGIGVVIGNQGKTFSAGANLMLILAAATEGAYDEIDLMVRAFQKATMAIKYSPVPVVVAPFQMTLGGGWEFCMHADAIVAHAETYMGPAEVGVGLLPAGGGTKELAIRAIDLATPYEADVSPFIFKNFRKIAMAKISSSADEARELGYLRDGDSITMNIDQLLYDAKVKVLSLASNYRPSHPREGIPAPGRSVAASIKTSIWNLWKGNFITEHEKSMAELIADVISGGDVPAGTPVSEQYFLDLEREAFLKLCGQKKTLERIQYTLKTGKTLRN